MRRGAMLFFGAAVGLACASPAHEAGPVPLCGPLESLPPLPGSCVAGELDAFSATLSDRLTEAAGRSLVRVELDEAASVRSVCIEEAPGYTSAAARRVGQDLDALRALPPGPACAAGRRLDLNRYEAKWAEVHDREVRCQEQTRVTRETHGETIVRNRTAGGAYGVYEREYEQCLEYDADWIVLDAPGSTRPWIYVKPEIPDPPGPRASDTRSRCLRKSRVFEKRAACIESEGWERLEPPKR